MNDEPLLLKLLSIDVSISSELENFLEFAWGFDLLVVYEYEFDLEFELILLLMLLCDFDPNEKPAFKYLDDTDFPSSACLHSADTGMILVEFLLFILFIDIERIAVFGCC